MVNKPRKPKTKKEERVIHEVAPTKNTRLVVVVEDNKLCNVYHYYIRTVSGEVQYSPKLAPDYWFNYSTDEHAERVLKTIAKQHKHVWDMREYAYTSKPKRGRKPKGQ